MHVAYCDNSICVSADWKPKTLNVSQLGSNLHVVFDSAPASFGFHFYYLYYKLRQDGPFRMQRCKPVSHIKLSRPTKDYYTIIFTCAF